MSFSFVLRRLSQQWLGDVVRKGTRSKKRSRRDPVHLPRVELLEDRTLMTTTPSPLPAALVTADSQRPLFDGTAFGAASTPMVVADPLDPQHLVAVAVTGTTVNAGNSGVTGAYSTNGGRDWLFFAPSPARRLWDEVTGVPASPGPNPTTFPTFAFTQANSPSVAFDRNHRCYVAVTETNAAQTSGALVLDKFDFTGPNPVTVAYDIDPFHSGIQASNVIYRWVQDDPVLNPIIAVDNNTPSFTDPQTGATTTDYLTNQPIYIAWNTNNTAPTLVNPSASFTPAVIKVMGSVDGGITWTTPVFVSGPDDKSSNYTSNPPIMFAQPQIIFPQGVSSEYSRNPSFVVSSMTSAVVTTSGNPTVIVTVNTTEATGLNVGDTVIITGANQAAYNGAWRVRSVIGGNTFTFQILGTSSAPASPATGDIRVTVPLADTGGQLTFFWNQFVAPAPGATEHVQINNNVSGGHLLSQEANTQFYGNTYYPTTFLINDADASTSPQTPGVTTDTIQVNITDPNFDFLRDLNVTVYIANPHMDQLAIVLTPPASTGIGSITLLRNHVDNTNAVISPVGPYADLTEGVNAGNFRNMGVMSAFNDQIFPRTTAFIPTVVPSQMAQLFDIGTVFDDEAARNIHDNSAIAPYGSSYKPEETDFPSPPTRGLARLDGLTPAQLNGTWKLTIIDFFNSGETSPPLWQFFDGWSLNFTSRISTGGFAGGGTNIATRGGPIFPVPIQAAATSPYPVKPPSSPDRGIAPTFSAVVDNTLGSFSLYQGRMYLAFTNNGAGDTNGTNSDIFLITSDDGGASWQSRGRLNQDSAGDNFSEGNRQQFMPSLAIDQTTGTLVATWYDARNDAANARVSRYIATSTDGGVSWSPETYLNASLISIDAITGAEKVLQPIPDNQSLGNPSHNPLFGFGEHQSLIVNAGHIRAVWTGNWDPNEVGTAVFNSTGPTSILTAEATIADGPRVISSDQGPVLEDYSYSDPRTTANVPTTVYNNTFAADGTRQLNAFVVRFDRPIDPSTFGPDDVVLRFRNTSTAVTPNGTDGTTLIPVTAVEPLDDGTLFGSHQIGGALDMRDPNYNPLRALATFFLVRFAAQSGVGTYSYAIGPNIQDRNRSADFQTVPDGGFARFSPSGPEPLSVLTLTSAGTTATVTTKFPHGLIPGDAVTITGASPSGYNGTFVVVAVNDPNTFTYQLSGPLPSPATGMIFSQAVSSSVPKTISDNTTVTSRLFVTGLKPRLADIRVNLTNLNHEEDGQLIITLISPLGTRVILSNGPSNGISGQNFLNTVFKQQAYQRVNQGVAPFTGDFLPDGTFPNSGVGVTSLAASAGSVFVTATNHRFHVGDEVIIAGAGPAGLNGTFIVTSVPDANHFTYQDAVTPVTANGAVAFHAGEPLSSLFGQDPNGIWTLEIQDTAQFKQGVLFNWSLDLLNGDPPAPALTVNSITSTGTTATVTTASPHGFADGTKVVITGATEAAYNGTYTITVLSPTSFTYTFGGALLPAATGNLSTYQAVSTQVVTNIRQGTTPIVVSGISSINNTATVTTAVPHNFNAGETIVIDGATPNAYNGTYVITQVVSPTQFRYTFAGAGVAASGSIVTFRLEAGNNVVVQTAQPHGYNTFDTINITGPNEAAYKGAYVITRTSPTTFIYTLRTVDPAVPPTLATGNLFADRYSVSVPVAGAVTTVNTTATVTTASAHGYVTGDVVTITGATQAAYNGSFIVTVISPTRFTYSIPAAAPAPTATGTISTYRTARALSVANLFGDGTTATLRTDMPHRFAPGDQVVIAGASQAGFDGTFTVTGVLDAYTFTFANGTVGTATGATFTYRLNTPTLLVSSLSGNGTKATVTTTTPETFAVGDVVVIAGASQAAFNGTFTITDVLSPTQFKFASGVVGNGTGSIVTFRYATATPSAAPVASLSGDGTTATVVTSTPHGFVPGDQIVIDGAANAGFNNRFVITTVANPFTFTFANNTAGADPSTTTVTYRFSIVTGVSALSNSGSTVTVQTAVNHGFVTNNLVTMVGATQAAYNGTFPVTVIDATTFKYTVLGSPVTPATGSLLAFLAPYDNLPYRTALGNFMDSDGDSVTKEDVYRDPLLRRDAGDVYAVPAPLEGGPFQLPYDDKHSLPLIIPGPRVAPPTTYTPNPILSVRSVTLSGTTATVTTASAHGLNPGDLVHVNGSSQDAFNGDFTVTAVVDANTFTYSLVGLTPSLVSSLSGNGTTATVTTSTPNGFKAGDLVVINGATPAAFNGTFVVTSTVDQYTFTFSSSVVGSASGTSITTYRFVPGTVVAPLVTSLSGSAGTVTARTATPQNYVVGEQVVISGANQAAFNGTFTVAVVVDPYTFTFAAGASGVATGTIITFRAATASVASPSVTNLSGNGTTATATTATRNGFTVGDLVAISGANQPGFNGVFTVTGVVDPFTFTFANSTSGSATGTITTYRFATGSMTTQKLVNLRVTPPQLVVQSINFSNATSLATVVTQTDHGFTSGDQITIAGADQPQYNGTFVVTVLNTTTFTFAPLTPPSVAKATGNISATPVGLRLPATNVSITAVSRTGPVVTVTTAQPHGFSNNEVVSIGGGSQVEYRGLFAVTVIDPVTFTFTVAPTARTSAPPLPLPQAPQPADMFAYARGIHALSIASLNHIGNTATVVTSVPHLFSTGNQVKISGANQQDYNGTFTITVTSPTTFTYSLGSLATVPATKATGNLTVFLLNPPLEPAGTGGSNVLSQDTTVSQISVSGVPAQSLTFDNSTKLATFVGQTAHRFTTGDQVTVRGANPPEFNGTYIVTVTSPTTFTYAPLNTPSGFTATGPITSDPADQQISSVTVTVSLTHKFDSNLVLTLVAPDGTAITLASILPVIPGTTTPLQGQNMPSVTFDDQALSPISVALAPNVNDYRYSFRGIVAGYFPIGAPPARQTFIGSYRPQTPLSTLNGHNPFGNWILKVQDTGGGTVDVLDDFGSPIFDTNGNPIQEASTGVLRDWSLSIGTTRVVLNATTNHTEVIFDRDINPASFTAAKVLSVTGPQGTVLPGPYTVTPIDTGLGLQTTRKFQIGFPAPVYVVQTITFNNTTGLATVTTPTGTGFSTGDQITISGANQPQYNGTFRVTVTSPTTFTYAPLTTPSAPNATGTLRARPDGQQLSGTYNVLIGAARLAVTSLTRSGTTATATTGTTPHGLTTGDLVTISGANQSGYNGSFFVTVTSPTTFTYQVSSGLATPATGTIVALTPSVSSAAGNQLDTNLNAGLYQLRGFDPTNPNLVNVVTSATAVPLGINAGRTVDAPLTVASNFAIEGTPMLQLNISVGTGSDLSATLIAPDGTRILLFDQIASATGADFRDTTFSDRATIPIANGTSPFNQFVSYNPQEPLSKLLGKAGAGVYTLEITNHSLSGSALLNSWSLTLQKSPAGTGTGEPLADRLTLPFRIFSFGSTNNLDRAAYTAVGPASLNNNQNAGRVTSIALDPLDPSGNTAYVGAASGGIWKTSNFLTSDPQGPSYVPLTDFGPNLSVNISNIALFTRNNDPNQTIIIASTGSPGDSAQLTPLGKLSDRGVGFLRSMDGGQTWTLLDSSNNLAATPNGAFRGTVGYKVAIGPGPNGGLPGQVTVYAALGDGAQEPQPSTGKGGIWRSDDSGDTWVQVLSGQATDVLLDPTNLDSTGRIASIYAGLSSGGPQGPGVYNDSANRGSGPWNLVNGQAGTLLIRDGDIPNNPPAIPVVNNPSPNGVGGRIVLARPVITGRPDFDLLYGGWIYAAVANANGTLNGLYLTKDFGANWTRVRLPVDPNTGAFASNNETRADFDPLGTANQAMVLTIDPVNPNIVYLGGSTIIRVDTTPVHDARNITAFDSSRTTTDLGPAPGTVQTQSIGAVRTKINPFTGREWSVYGMPEPPNAPTALIPYLNLVKDPADIFGTNATLLPIHIQNITNNGMGADWVPFFDATTSNPFNPLPTPLPLSETNHQNAVVAITDPITGRTRLVFGNDQGVYSFVDGTEGRTTARDSIGIGTAVPPTGSRNGNLQIAQMFQGAVQPSVLAAQLANALFYGTTQDNGVQDQSTGNSIDTGDLSWTAPFANGNAQGQGVGDPTGSGTGVATDPTGTGTSYHYGWPKDMQIPTNFFQVTNAGGSPTGQTQGLLQAGDNPGTGAGQWPSFPGLNFTVNTVDASQIIISSTAGRVFRTRNKGATWQVIAQPNQVGSVYAPALAYGAPDPSVVGKPTDDFVYVGNVLGQIWVNTYISGGGTWTNISNGLDGSPVVEISANTEFGSKSAVAVTQRGVYYLADSTVATPTWVNITGNLFSITRPNQYKDLGFQNAPGTQSETALLPNPGAVGNQLFPDTLTALVADWRDKIPDNPNNPTGPTHPAIYVGGLNGVFRSTSLGVSAPGNPGWTIFPDVAHDGALVNGGNLPNVPVTDLDLAPGSVIGSTGVIDQATGPNLLLVTTFGRGQFAIRLNNNDPFNPYPGPRIVDQTPAFPVAGNPGLSQVTVTFADTIDPGTFSTADVTLTFTPLHTGPSVQIPITSVTDITSVQPGTPNPHNHWQITFPNQSGPLAYGDYQIVIGPSIFDYSGRPMDQNANGITGEPPPGPGQFSPDLYVHTFQVDGLQVVSVTPANPVTTPPGLQTIIVTFNTALQPQTFTTDDIVLQFKHRPTDAPTTIVLQPSDLTDITTPLANGTNLHNLWQITLPNAPPNNPPAAGFYTLDIGPNILDTFGNQMDQNRNGAYGEPGVATGLFTGGDVFEHVFIIEGLRVSSVTTDVLPFVDPTHAVVNPPSIHGFLLTFNREVDPNSFDFTDLVLTGPGATPGSTVSIDLSGAQLMDLAGTGTNPLHNVWDVVLANTLTTPGVYTLTVGPHITDSTGGEMDQDQDFFYGNEDGDSDTVPPPGSGPTGDGLVTQFTVVGLQVTGIDPAGPLPVPTGLTQATIHFNMDVGSFPTNAVHLTQTADQFGNPSNVQVPILNLIEDDPRTWHISFAGLTSYGTYTLVVDPNVTDTAFHAMNQHQLVDPTDGDFGQPNDAFIGTFQIAGLLVKDAIVTGVPLSGTQPLLLSAGETLTSIDVTFNMAVATASFQPLDAKLLLPDGTTSVTATGVSDLTTAPGGTNLHNVWRLTFPGQLAPGVYTFTLGPNINDTGSPTSHPMDQNNNQNPGEAGFTPVPTPPVGGDGFIRNFVIDGLRVVSTTPTNDPTDPTPHTMAAPVGLKSIIITFNYPVDPATFSPSDITLRGPAQATPSNPIVPLGTLTDLTTGAGGTNLHDRWMVTVQDVNGLTAYGDYTLTLGPDIRDRAGNQMNQNDNRAYGDAGFTVLHPTPATPADGDGFIGRFTIDGLKVIDIAPGRSTLIVAPPSPPSVSQVIVTFNIGVDASSFASSDVVITSPTGAVIGVATPIDLTTIGPNPTNLHDRWELDFAPQTTEGAYSVIVGPHISNLAGTEMDQNNNRIAGENGVTLLGGPNGVGDGAKSFFDIVGLKVKSISPSSPTQSPPGVSSVTITFNEAVDSTTFALADDIKLQGPTGAAITPTSLTGSGAIWHLNFPAQSAGGLYTVTVGPHIKDLAGNEMNQNSDATPGQEGAAPLGDQFQGTFGIQGLQVVSAVVAGQTPASPFPLVLTPPGLTTITVTFNRGVKASTFTTADVTLTLPGGGTLAPTGVTDATVGNTNLHDVWTLTFPQQTAEGVYTLTVGPSITDLSNSAMDQNQNLNPGQPGPAPAGDAFQTQFGLTKIPPTPPITTLTGPTDVTGLVTILFGPLRKVRKYRDAQGRIHRGNFFARNVSIFNVSNTLIQGPFALALDGLTRGVKLVNRTGFTMTQPPLGSPYQQLNFSANQLASLQGGTFSLVFKIPAKRKLRFSARLLAGVAVP
jgi:subtilisin-like proprotein convertase family protein